MNQADKTRSSIAPTSNKSSKVVEVDVGASVDVVFDFLVDPQRMRTWAHDVDEVRFVSGGPERTGSIFRQCLREEEQLVEYEGEVLACERPSHLRVSLTTSRRTLEVDYVLTARGSQARLQLRTIVHERSWVQRALSTVFGDDHSLPGETHLAHVKRAVEDSRDVS